MDRFWQEGKFDVAKAEAATSKETPEAAAKREYLFQVLPYLGTTLDVEGKLATGFGAFDATFSDRLTASVAPLNQSMTRARSGVTSIKPPAGAEQVHREVSAAIEAVQLLTSGLEDAGRQKTMRAFAEAYRPLGTLLTTSDLDCSWRQLVAATGITGPTGACTPPSPAKKADVEYAFGAFVVMGGLADSFTNLTPKSPKTAAEFAEYSTSLARAAMTAQRDAVVLRPVASSAPYHDALTGYLADLQRESEALAQAFRTPNASRAQASAAAIQELLTVRTREVGALFDAMYKASIRR